MSTRLSLAEQETVILLDNELDSASIYTHDARMIRRLTELAEKYPRLFAEQYDPDRHAERLSQFRPGIRYFQYKRTRKDQYGRWMGEGLEYFRLPDGTNMEITEWKRKVGEIIRSDERLFVKYEAVKEHCRQHCMWLKKEDDLSMYAYECFADGAYKAWRGFRIMFCFKVSIKAGGRHR